MSKIYTKECLEELRKRINSKVFFDLDFPKSGVIVSDRIRCPFHCATGDDDCLIYNSEFKKYHCFNCGASGDIIDLLMILKKMSFQEVVEYLADKFNVQLKTMEMERSKSEVDEIIDSLVVNLLKLKDMRGRNET